LPTKEENVVPTIEPGITGRRTTRGPLVRRRVAKTPDEPLLKMKSLTQRYERTVRTITRWRDDPRLNFPAPDLQIFKRSYWRPATIEKWEEKRAQKSAT
jgi:hypothetical protein